MGPDSAHRHGPSRYEGEDRRLTSKKELAGWYAYSFAAEVFIICGIGSFIPITLEQLARENGVLLSDKTTPCASSSTRLSPELNSDTYKRYDACVTFVFGMQINTASFAMYTFSLSVLLQVLLVVSISCAADHGNYRKKLLLIFSYSGAFSTMLFLFIVPDLYLLAALLAIISNTCSAASFVLLNSFLPLLVRHHPRSQYQRSDSDSIPSTTATHHLEDHQNPDDDLRLLSESPLLPEHPNAELLPTPDNSTSVELQLSTQISSIGIGAGYSAGLFVQCALTVIIWLMGSTTLALRVVLFLVGLWWALFTIPAIFWLRPRPGPALGIKDLAEGFSSPSLLSYAKHSWSSLWRTFKIARGLKDITVFSLAWFLLSDAIATVSGTAILYAKTSLHMRPEALGVINIITTTAGVLGAFTWTSISRNFGLKPHQTVLVCICLFEIVPLYGLLGYLPLVKSWDVIGLQQPWEMYPVGFIYGFALGGLSSHCRSIFGGLIPPGFEAAFYALYSITDKGSSIFGPAIVGVIIDTYGEIRPAFWFVAILVGLPAPLIWFLNPERGNRDAQRVTRVFRRVEN